MVSGFFWRHKIPGDLDYKALSNVGTWFIGRLQTERDKEKVLEGLVTANSGADKGELSKKLAGLGKAGVYAQQHFGGKPGLVPYALGAFVSCRSDHAKPF